MRGKKKHYEMDMTQGPLLGNIIRFSLPLMFTGMLQLLYNAADVVIVGRFASAHALAAVSSTGAMINLIVGVFMGLSLGTSVAVAQAYGAGNYKDVQDTVHTSIAMAIVCGLVVSVLGLFLGKPLLRLMDTPEEVLDLASLYVSIYFSGSLFNLVYNFGAAILRAVGDTRRPMYFLILSGLVNVVLNMFFVIVLDMSVAGVALATVASQVLSAVLVVVCLIRSQSSIQLNPRRLRIVKDKALKMIKIGIPAGLQGAIFSMSNVVIQSSVNSFGADAMAGNGAAANIEGFVYMAMNAFYTASLTFTSQNLGARKTERLGRIMWLCQGCVILTGIVLGAAVYAFRGPLIGIYCEEQHVIEFGMRRTAIIAAGHFFCGSMDVFVGGLRGMGKSFVPMIISILGSCMLRIIWVATVFAAFRTPEVLYLCYPLSWAITGLAQGVYYVMAKRKVTREMALEAQTA